MALNKTMTFDLELKPGGIPPIIHASQGDIGRMFKANIYWDGSAATSYVSGATVNLRGKKPDKTVFDYTATLAGSMVTFETTEQMTIISGPVECELVFSQGGDVIASANFVLQVEESPYDPNNLSESDVEGLADVLEGFQRLNRDSNGVVKIGDGVTASGTAEPIKGFYLHDEVTNTDGVAKVSIEAVQEFEDDIRDETANWLENNPDIWSPVPDDSLTTEKYKDDSVTGAKLANAAVTTEKIENGSVTEDKINFPVSVSHAFLTKLDNEAFQGSYWGTGKAFQSVAYNPNTKTFLLAYSGATIDADGLLVEIDDDFQFIRRALVNAGHLNDLTYIPEKDVYYVANSYGTGKVAVIDPETLEITETLIISGVSSTIDQISYNENVGDLFFTSNRVIYKSDLDFTNVIEYGEQETAKMTDSPYKNIDTRYLQGSCAFNDQFVSAWWLGVADLEEGASYNRICLFDTAGTFVRFFDHMSQDEIDELEGLAIVGGKILSFGYTGSNITVSAIFLNGETGGPNNPITFERVRYVTSSSILEDIHENAVRNTAYAYIVAFRNEHPVLGGVNGTLFGCKTSAGYGWQVFISPNKTATRRQHAGSWGNWALDVAQETAFWLGSKPFLFVRKGQTVTCYAPNDLNNVSSGETVVGTLGELFRPPYVVRARVQNNNANIFVTVETSGEVKIYCPSAITTAVNGAFHFSYVV